MNSIFLFVLFYFSAACQTRQSMNELKVGNVNGVRIPLSHTEAPWALTLIVLGRDRSVGFCSGAVVGYPPSIVTARHCLNDEQGSPSRRIFIANDRNVSRNQARNEDYLERNTLEITKWVGIKKAEYKKGIKNHDFILGAVPDGFPDLLEAQYPLFIESFPENDDLGAIKIKRLELYGGAPPTDRNISSREYIKVDLNPSTTQLYDNLILSIEDIVSRGGDSGGALIATIEDDLGSTYKRVIGILKGKNSETPLHQIFVALSQDRLVNLNLRQINCLR